MRVKKLLCSILALVMMLSTMNMVTFAEEASVVFSGSGTIEDPWEIGSYDELKAFAEGCAASGNDNYRNQYFELTSDIDLNGEEWEPIYLFRGNLDGGKHTISNFKIGNGYYNSSVNSYYTGFFAYVYGSVNNLTLEDIEINISGGARSFYGGSFAYKVKNGAPIENLHVKNVEFNADVDVELLCTLGGFIGENDGIATNNCSVENLTMNVNVGATNSAQEIYIAGYIANNIGTAASHRDSSVSNFTANVVNESNINCSLGGFIGQTQNGHQQPSITNCSVTGVDITASGLIHTGGFIAQPGAHTAITNCSVTGEIDASNVTETTKAVGGFMANNGWNNNESNLGGHVVTDCTAAVDIISGGAAAGGFVGSATCDDGKNMPVKFINCSASGNVENSNGYAGGFAGSADKGIFINCTAAESLDFIGYIIPSDYDLMINPVEVTDGTDTTLYPSLPEAVNAADDGDTVRLLADVKLAEKLTIDEAITIDGNGHSIIADETAVWYTVSGKLNIKNYNKHLIGVNSDNITFQNIVLDNNNNAAGINIYCAQNVVFDNVSIINSTKGFAALTVNGSTLTAKTKFVALGNAVAIDIDLGSGVTSPLGVTVEEGTIFDLGGKTVKFDSAAVNDMTGAITEDNKPYFAAMDNAYYYTVAQIENRTTAFSNGLTMLADVNLSKDLKIEGTLDLNGKTLTVAEGKAVNVDSKLTITGDGTIDGKLNLSNLNATITGPEGFDVTVSDDAYFVKYVNGVYTAVEKIAQIGDNYYSSLKDAFAALTDGDTIELLKDTALDKAIAFTKDIEFTLDGNGHKITLASDSTETNSAFNLGQGNDGTRATKKYNLKDIVFDGWTTDHVVRLQGTTSVIENCKFINCNQTGAGALGLLTLTFCDATIKGCTFENNNCAKAIDINSWGDDSQSNVTIENSLFNNNDCTQNAVVLASTGLSTTVKNSKFINNKVVSNINGATLYLGFNTGIKAIDNYFENNEVEISSTQTTSARPYRSAGAIFAGFADDNCAITGNAFINNKLKLDDADAAIKSVAYSAYYGAGNISGNYWGKSTDPVENTDYSYEYSDENALFLNDYYADINVDDNKDFVLSNLKSFQKHVKLEFVDVTPNDTEGEKLYNINITASELIINRLNSVDLSFIHTMIEGDTEFEIIASNEEVAINPVNNSKNRYEFHYNGKTDVETDTATTITIGQVKFAGYGEFSFAVDANVTTNVAHATKSDDNIVDTFVPGGVLADGTVVGDFDVTTNFITDIIAVPTRTLTIDITFPNAVENNVKAYQDMTVTIVGGTVNETIALGTDGENYNFTRELPYNTAYTVTVSGAGYRTARYTVNLNDDKQLNFWNNVMDEAQVVEIGKDSSVAKVTFLAGDIVKDNNINIYDLSAVVSYFGEELDTAAYNEYAKYDLNRDGVIDSKDVAYVLVSWNN